MMGGKYPNDLMIIYDTKYLESNPFVFAISFALPVTIVQVADCEGA